MDCALAIEVAFGVPEPDRLPTLAHINEACDEYWLVPVEEQSRILPQVLRTMLCAAAMDTYLPSHGRYWVGVFLAAGWIFSGQTSIQPSHLYLEVSPGGLVLSEEQTTAVCSALRALLEARAFTGEYDSLEKEALLRWCSAEGSALAAGRGESDSVDDEERDG